MKNITYMKMDSKFEILKYLEDEEIDKNSVSNTISECLESQEIQLNANECVICLEKIEENDFSTKFPCTHNKMMHKNCVKSLSKCPLCRTFINGRSDIINNNNTGNRQFVSFGCLTIFGLFCVIIFGLSQSMMMVMSTGTYINFNSTNTTNI